MTDDFEFIRDDLFKTESSDFVVRVRPMLDRYNRWTGEIDMAIVTRKDNYLSDDDYDSVMHFTKMMCSTVPLMENDKELRSTVNNYVLDRENNWSHKEKLKKDLQVNKINDNVIRVDFKKGDKE
tara:strand:+ start:3133 stop:3504 length:372 start_codon:yes stop_codon:yes gene_type:complete